MPNPTASDGEAPALAQQVIIEKSGMGRNKTLKERIATLRRRVRQHENKIRRQRRSKVPDMGVIDHWKAEIDTWKRQIARAQRRLERQR